MADGAKRYLRPYASLKLTVALLAMATVLVFAGTVAQIDKGIWTVVDDYFRCPVAWIDLRIFFPRAWDVPGGFWFPGGWLIAGLLLLNVLAAHLVRFKIAATGPRLVAGCAIIAAGAVLTGLIIAGVFDQDVAATESAAFWRVLLRLGKGGGAAIVLMTGCQLVFGRRGGVVLLHAGIILLLVSEFVTGTFAVEGRMRINAGESVNFVEHMRSVELAFVDRSDPAVDRLIVIPAKRLRNGQMISNPALPFDLRIEQTMRNCQIIDATMPPPGAVNLATTGSGTIALAVEEGEISGTEAQTIDMPALYVTLVDRDSGEAIDTYLTTTWLKNTRLERQDISYGDRVFDVQLRFARTYKPYSIELVEFRHDKYVGTEKAKNFSSMVRLVDESKGVDRTVKIWMNNPLRYAGETFYQSSFEPGKDLTILQVVRNRGWMIPYLSCMLVGVGMSMHMGGNLITFLRRRITR